MSRKIFLISLFFVSGLFFSAFSMDIRDVVSFKDAIKKGKLDKKSKKIIEESVNKKNVSYLVKFFSNAIAFGRDKIVEFIFAKYNPIIAKEVEGGYLLGEIAGNRIPPLENVEGKCIYKPIHIAALKGELKIVKFLYKHFQNLDYLIKCTGDAPLHLALKNGNVDVVDFILDQPVRYIKLDHANNSGKYPIVLAINDLKKHAGDKKRVKVYKKMVELLIKKDRNNVDKLLHPVVLGGNLEILKLLLNNGADLKSKDSDNNTPLHIAVKNGYVDIVKLICTKDPQAIGLDSVNKFVKTPLILAIEGTGENKRESERLKVYKTIIDLLLKAGANINQPADAFGNTPLHAAIIQGFSAIARTLIRRGANCNFANKFGDYPITIAVKKGYYDLVKALINKNVDLSVKNKKGDTPIHIALEKVKLSVADFTKELWVEDYGKEEALKKILEKEKKQKKLLSNRIKIAKLIVKKMDVQKLNELGSDGYAPLYKVVKRGYFRVFESLVDKGVNLNVESEEAENIRNLFKREGRRAKSIADSKVPILTPIVLSAQLMAANKRDKIVYQVYKEMVQYLAEKEANVNAIDIKYKTPLFYVSELDLVKHLVQYGANVSWRDIFKKTAREDINEKRLKGVKGDAFIALKRISDYLYEQEYPPLIPKK